MARVAVKDKLIAFLQKELARVDRRLAAIKAIHEANPVGKILELHQQAAEIVKKHKNDNQKIAELLKPLAEEDKAQRLIMKKQCNPKLYDEQQELWLERHDIINELAYMKRR